MIGALVWWKYSKCHWLLILGQEPHEGIFKDLFLGEVEALPVKAHEKIVVAFPFIQWKQKSPCGFIFGSLVLFSPVSPWQGIEIQFTVFRPCSRVSKFRIPIKNGWCPTKKKHFYGIRWIPCFETQRNKFKQVYLYSNLFGLNGNVHRKPECLPDPVAALALSLSNSGSSTSAWGHHLDANHESLALVQQVVSRHVSLFCM